MANPHRGEVDLVLPAGTLTLRLTLGALAELEGALGAPHLAGLAARLSAGEPAARDALALLGAAARGGGARLTDAQVGAMVGAGDLPAVADALARLLSATFGSASGTGAGEGAPPGPPPAAGRAPGPPPHPGGRARPAPSPGARPSPSASAACASRRTTSGR